MRMMLLLVLLAVLGTFVAIVYTNPQTADVNFTYQRAIEYEDGTPLSLAEIKYTRLYCDGQQVAQEVGADGDISAALTVGSHDCYGTHVATNDVESNSSNAATKLVEL